MQVTLFIYWQHKPVSPWRTLAWVFRIPRYPEGSWSLELYNCPLLSVPTVMYTTQVCLFGFQGLVFALAPSWRILGFHRLRCIGCSTLALFALCKKNQCIIAEHQMSQELGPSYTWSKEIGNDGESAVTKVRTDKGQIIFSQLISHPFIFISKCECS